MIPVKANEVDFEDFEIFGHEALFTNLRVDRKSIPEGLYAYNLRDEDSTGEICELKSCVMVNHWGTVITKEPIEGADEGIPVEPDDYNYLGSSVRIEDFAKTELKFEQTMG